MCGIFGILAARSVSLSDSAVALLRDTMAHRGPDGAGLWRRDGCVLAHRRLKVVDVSDAAAQPMVSADGRHVIVYNGELYNDADVREELGREGVRFCTVCDTETVLAALVRWGAGGLAKLRGMYALAMYDTVTRKLLLARDPLGIKPLYYRIGPTADGEAVIFASEARAILEHPDVPARPDWVTVSAYLSTIRTVMGERTLFEGVRAVRAGEIIEIEVGEEVQRKPFFQRRGARGESAVAMSASCLRETITDSVLRHLRSDVPVCCMLSGGLDSSIVAAVAKAALGELTTYCSGAAAAGGGTAAPDFEFARLMSSRLGTRHVEAPVSRELFGERWPEMVSRMGVPLSTPNEVAINEVARRMRAEGNVVALSGEGADELFAGYDLPMLDASRFEGLLPRDRNGAEAAWLRPGVLHGGDFQLASNAWIQPGDKAAVLAGDVWRACEHDEMLRVFYREEFDAAAEGAGRDSPLQTHLRFHRRNNLQGLLARLDTATMLEGVEGRTPLADWVVCGAAEAMGMDEKFVVERGHGEVRVETKRALRRAFAGDLPREVLERPKASFPLPMQEWVSDQAAGLRRSRFAREVFTMAAVETVAAQAEQCWPLAWPMMNVAMWGEAWWG